MQQIFVIDGDSTVDTALKNAEKEAGAPIKIESFVRFALGEGISKEPTPDFASEVKAISG